MSLIIRDNKNKIVDVDSGGKFKIHLPEPTAVGKSQSFEYVIRNDSKNDRFEIIEVVSGHDEIDVEIRGEKYMFPKDEIHMLITYHPKEDRKVPLTDAEILVKTWRIMEPQH